MKVVTIVQGLLYERMAEITIPLMQECLDQEVITLEGGNDSWARKLELLDDDIYTFVDVDVVFRKRYDLRPLTELAKEGYFVAPIPDYAARLNLPPTFVTSGMMVVNPQYHRDMLQLARSRYVFPGLDSLKDEYALNEALVESSTPVHMLPRYVHRIAHSGIPFTADDVSRHYCGGNGSLVRLSHIRDAADESWKNLRVPPPPRKSDTWLVEVHKKAKR